MNALGSPILRGPAPLRAALLAAGMMIIPSLAFGQYAVVGGLGNFDAANFEGKDAHGLEVQIEGIQPSDLYPAWCGNKYSCPVVVPYATGVYVRYVSSYDAANHRFVATTVPKIPGPFAGTCYMGSLSYLTAGCDHFGVHLAYTATAGKAVVTSYRWMFEDPANLGTLIASTTNIFIPTPVYTWVPPVIPTNPPVLVVEIQTPPPPPPPPAIPPQYGDATWMKVFKTEMNREVALDELTSDNPIVPQTVAQVETEWVLMQPEPPSDARRRGRNRHQNRGNVNAGVRAVLRRYETYAYTGAYDPITHQVVCAGDATCTAPLAGELGEMIAAQMTAANVAVPSLTVTLTGNGAVSSGDKVISCGSKCASTYALGAVVTLTAKAGSNSTFTSWTGGGCGANSTCAVTIADAMTVNALFTANPAGGGGGGTTAQFTVQIGRSNSGTVTSDVAGINCGSACSAKFNTGTVLTLTATPPAGKTFADWGGACSGTGAVCTLTVSGNLSVQANFNK